MLFTLLKVVQKTLSFEKMFMLWKLYFIIVQIGLRSPPHKNRPQKKTVIIYDHNTMYLISNRILLPQNIVKYQIDT